MAKAKNINNAKNSKSRKQRIFEIIQIGQKEDLPSRAFDLFIVISIMVNIAVLIMETFSGLKHYKIMLEKLELITIAIFGMEYLLRIWTAEYLYPKCSRGKAILKFLISFDGIVDLFTILPFFYLSGFVAFRMLRVVRIFHLFRINAYYDSFNVITSVLYEKKNQIFSSVFIILVLMVASSLCMYSAEHEAQPGVFDNAFSGLWWSIATILTVGYGDIYPVTTIGRIMATVIAFLGVGAVAIPTGIISAGFVEQYTQMQTTKSEKEIKATVHMKLDTKHPFVKRTIKDIEKNYKIDIIVVVRDGNVLISTENIKLKADDTIVYQTDAVKI